jgi:hypothetical protein
VPHFVKGPDDPTATIWRYMDFTRLVSMLDSRSLWFSSAHLLGDPFEGSTPTLQAGVIRQQLSELGDTQAADTMSWFREKWTRATFVNCWNLSHIESAALWGLYVPATGGVAIRSTYDRLKQAIDLGPPQPDDAGPENPDLTPRINIGCVNYLDWHSEGIPQGFTQAPYCYKRMSFAFENEIRAVFQQPPIRDLPTGGFDWELEMPAGVKIAADLDLLIERIHISPVAPQWFGELVSDVCKRYDVTAPVAQSSLAGSPVY